MALYENYMYHDEEITIPESFKELTDIVSRYENTDCAEHAITAFENSHHPIIEWEGSEDIPEKCFSVVKMIATYTHNWYTAVAKGDRK